MDRKMEHGTKNTWLNQIREVQMWRQVRRLAEALMCETRDLGIKWPQWRTWIVEGEVRIDMIHVCPKDVKNMLVMARKQTGDSRCFQKVGAKSENLKEGVGMAKRYRRASSQ